MALGLPARLLLCTAVAAVALPVAACGSSESGGNGGGAGSGSVTFSGDVTGSWTKAGESSESTCSATEAVIHIQGPSSGDEGDLHVKADGSVFLDAEKYGDFTATSGGTLKPSKGLSVDADIATVRGKQTHVKGDLSC